MVGGLIAAAVAVGAPPSPATGSTTCGWARGGGASAARAVLAGGCPLLEPHPSITSAANAVATRVPIVATLEPRAALSAREGTTRHLTGHERPSSEPDDDVPLLEHPAAEVVAEGQFHGARPVGLEGEDVAPRAADRAGVIGLEPVAHERE